MTDIRSLTEFKRNTARLVARMKKTRHPLVLTVNGRAEAVVFDAETYQRLVEFIDRAEAVEGIQRGLESFARGEGRVVNVSSYAAIAPRPYATAYACAKAALKVA